jgi:hypothetical protein
MSAMLMHSPCTLQRSVNGRPAHTPCWTARSFGFIPEHSHLISNVLFKQHVLHITQMYYDGSSTQQDQPL